MLVLGIFDYIINSFTLINIAMVWVVFKLTSFIYTNFIRRPFDLKERYGGWALVTGATDGIGKGFCEELANRGFNIIIVGRNEEKLKKVEKEIKDNYKVDTMTINFDFNLQTSLEDYDKAFGIINKDVSILVNNIGMNKVSESFEMNTKLDVRSFINLNVIPQATLTKMFIDKLNKREKKSAIINLSSYATWANLPYNSLYCATKSYNDILSKCLSNEYSEMNVDFLSAKPLFVESPLSKMKADGIYVITARECADGILKYLGHTNYTIGSWKHQIQAAFLYCIPERIIINSIKKMHARRMARKAEKQK